MNSSPCSVSPVSDASAALHMSPAGVNTSSRRRQDSLRRIPPPFLSSDLTRKLLPPSAHPPNSPPTPGPSLLLSSAPPQQHGERDRHLPGHMPALGDAHAPVSHTHHTHKPLQVCQGRGDTLSFHVCCAIKETGARTQAGHSGSRTRQELTVMTGSGI